MNPHDYIISVNEKGEPYLEHALFGKGSAKDNHKWYARENIRGKWRYWYSPEEYRSWQQGRDRQAKTEKKVSNSDKMRSAFRQIKETGQKVAEKAKDIAGVDERQRMKSAEATLKSDSTNALNRFKRHTDYTKAKADYDKTLLGKSERMKEEFRKKAEQAVDKAKDKVKEKVDEIKTTYEDNKRQFEKAKEMERAEAERQAKLENRPTAHKKPEVAGTAKDGAMKRRSMEKSTYGEYKDGDHDFDDDNYKEENRVGDTDFFVHKRKDGTNVILEEDMKWVLPKGVNANSPVIQKAIKDFSDEVESARRLGENYTGKQWTDAVTKAIDEAVRSTPVSGTKSSANKSNANQGSRSSNSSLDPHNVSSEYLLEMGSNSGLNVAALKVADAKHAKAQRKYDQAISNPNTSSQEKDRLFRELTKAEQAYYDEADKIIDELNQK